MNIQNNKFSSEYFQIIKNAQNSKRIKGDGFYYENHHIIPKSCGGDNTKDNLVLLTLSEHYRCHSLLPYFTLDEDKHKMLCAWKMMNNIHGENVEEIGEDLYSQLRTSYSKSIYDKGACGSKYSLIPGMFFFKSLVKLVPAVF